MVIPLLSMMSARITEAATFNQELSRSWNSQDMASFPGMTVGVSCWSEHSVLPLVANYIIQQSWWASLYGGKNITKELKWKLSGLLRPMSETRIILAALCWSVLLQGRRGRQGWEEFRQPWHEAICCPPAGRENRSFGERS